VKPEIIPTIFALDKKNFEQRLEKIKFSKKIHLDFMDGDFVNNKSFTLDEIDVIKNYDNEFELHLMAKDPEQYLNKIKELNIKKVLIHYEAFENSCELISTMIDFENSGIKVFIVLNPETQVLKIKNIISKISGVMLMSVNPGNEGQEFILEVSNKIKEIKELNPKLSIQIDGGINETNIEEISKFGMTILNIGSAISKSENPKSKFEELNNLI